VKFTESQDPMVPVTIDTLQSGLTPGLSCSMLYHPDFWMAKNPFNDMESPDYNYLPRRWIYHLLGKEMPFNGFEMIFRRLTYTGVG